MPSRSEEYWQKRFEALNEALLKEGDTYYAEVEKSFRRASAKIEADIARWYERIAKNNQVSLLDAKKLLSKDELQEFHWDVEEYIKRGKENGISKDWSRQLENASAKFHISRLEALRIQMQQHLEELYGNYTDDLDATMRGIYSDGYYKTAYALQTGVGAGSDMMQLDQKTLDGVVNKPWAADGANFSSRIWKDKTQLINTLHDELMQSMIRGDRLQDVIRRFAKRMDVSLSSAGRLIATESAYFASAGEKAGMEELGVEQYKFLATLDMRTSEICQSMDGKVIPMSEFKPGVTAPPLHCYCRSCTVPYVGDLEGSMRAARDEKGKTVMIPANMTYADWRAVFVDKSKTLADVGIKRYTKDIKVPEDAVSGVKGMTPEMFRMLSNTIDEVEKRYKIAASAKMVVQDLGKDKARVPLEYQGIENANWMNHQIVINPGYNWTGSIDTLNTNIRKNYDIGYLAAKDLRGLLLHEVGHLLTFQDCDAWEKMEYRNEELNENFVGGISGYADAKHDGSESLTEAFVRKMNGEDIPEKAKDLIEEYIERWKK